MPTRIASLLPGGTQILCALGRTEFIVGVSHECGFPPEVVGRPMLTAPRDDAESGASQTGDAALRLVRSGLSLHAIKEDALRAARPDLIVTRDRADTCGALLAEVERAVCEWLGRSVTVVSLKPCCLEDIVLDVKRVAGAVHAEFQGRELVAEMREKLDTIHQRAGRVRSHPRVACIERIDPLMVAGDWIPDLVDLCGGTYGLVRPGEAGRVIDWRDLVAYEPEVVVLMPRGLTLKETRRQRVLVTERAEWPRLPAVHNKRVYSADGTAYLYPAGPRIADGAALIAGLVQPSFFASRIPAGSYELVR